MANTPNSQSGKMSQVQQVPGLDATIRLCCRRSQRAKFQCLDLESGQTPEWYEAEALISLGACTTPNTSEQHSGAGVSFLSQILEANAAEKYSLSPKACQGNFPCHHLLLLWQNGRLRLCKMNLVTHKIIVPYLAIF